MRPLLRIGWFSIISLLVMFATPLRAEPETSRRSKQPVIAETVVIRVGITEYQDLEETYAKYLEFFQELTSQYQKRARNGNLDFKFRVAVGSYEEVKDWYNTNRIDVGILSAMPVSELFISTNTNQDPEFRKALHDSYLGTLTPIPENSPFNQCRPGETRHTLYDEIYSEKDKETIKPATDFYRTVYVAPGGSPLDNSSKLRQQAGHVRFLFVRPYSVSGYLLPAYKLRTKNPFMDFTREDYEFTYQHSSTLKKLTEAKEGKDIKDGKYLVAFVQDNLIYCTKATDKTSPLQRVQVPVDEKQMRVPGESLLVNYHLEEGRRKTITAIMADVFKEWHEEKASLFRLRKATEYSFDDWFESFTDIEAAIQTVAKPSAFSQRFTIDQVVRDLELYQQAYEDDKKAHNGSSTMRPPRLALVLSGGGAKCAYQAGAVNALEEKLKHEQDLGHKLDIDLVVGTSGGAINALFVAMGASRPPSAACLKDMWSNFNQEDFFQPSSLFNFIFGLCLGLLQALIITVATLLFGRDLVSWNLLGKCLVGLILIEAGLAIYFNLFSILSRRASRSILVQVIVIYIIAIVVRLLRRLVKNWWRQAGWLMVFVSFVEIILRWWSPRSLPESLARHLFPHLWAMMKLFSIWSAPFPLLLGLAMLFSGYRRVPDIVDFDKYRARLLRTLSAGVMIVISLFFMYSLLKEDSPSYATGIESKFIEALPKLGVCMKQPFLEPGLVTRTGSAMEDISRQTPLERDLIITASRLPMDVRHEDPDPGTSTANKDTLSANELPEDLYFYYKGLSEKTKETSAPPPPPGTQFISLADNKDKLLDIVIGSGTIYPLFPYRTISAIKVDNRTVPAIDIIDGGFTHNVPVDAAIKWDATHIILIEASPADKAFAPHHFLDNLLVAFNYLFAQAQHIDADKGSTEIFELRPTSECEKLSKIHKCDDTTLPDMDTFDFDPGILTNAYGIGERDMLNASAPLKRRSGEPLFRDTIWVPNGPRKAD
jgi:predicted acylesterase/phospholipase RssA